MAHKIAMTFREKYRNLQSVLEQCLSLRLRSKVKQDSVLKNEINVIYTEIRETCLLLRCYQELMTGHIRKTAMR